MMKQRKKMGKKTIRVSLIILGVLILVGVLLYFGFVRQSVLFELDYLPYGESVNQITDLNLISKYVQPAFFDIPSKYSILMFTSKYWNITQEDYVDNTCSRCSAAEEQGFYGSDLNYFSSAGKATVDTLVSTEYFNEKDFKATFKARPVIDPASPFHTYLTPIVSLNLIGDNGEVTIINHFFEAVAGPSDLNVLVKPSVITDKIFIYENGKKIKEITYNGKYKIKIIMNPLAGRINMVNPSYKTQFGCLVKPNEQFYVNFFNEGDVVNINKLDNFNKFCLDEAPLKLYSNIGSTTNTEILEGLVNNQQYVVPQGQIWSIEYIGEKAAFKTVCEQNYALNLKDNRCLSRAVITLNCAEGYSFDFEKGYCIIETLPSVFKETTIETHQTLENINQFRITHVFDIDDETHSSPSIIIGSNTFSSNGASYENGVWYANFNFKGNHYNAKLNEVTKLNDIISVKITDINGLWSGSFKNYLIDYTFSIDVNFLIPSYKDNVITIDNKYETFDGGIVVTKTNNLGTTTIDKIDKKLNIGTTDFTIDTTNIVDFSARPFITITTPGFLYTLDGKYAITNKNRLEQDGTLPDIIGFEKTTLVILVIISFGVLLLIITFFTLKKTFLKRK